MVDLLEVDYEFGIEGINLFRSVEIFCGLVVVFQCFVRKSSSEVGVGVVWLDFDDFIEVF